MNYLQENLWYGCLAACLAAYCLVRQDSTAINENKQRLQKHSEETCLTQIGDTRYFAETIKVNPLESIDAVCVRGDLAAGLFINYLQKPDLKKMNSDTGDDGSEIKIISMSELLDYFKRKRKQF